MSQSAGAVRNGLVLRFSVPSTGEMRGVATALAIKVAEQLGVKPQGGGVADAMEDLARSLHAGDGDDVAFEFHKNDKELKIEARSNGRVSEARIALPA
jgi:hypothetical protein